MQLTPTVVWLLLIGLASLAGGAWLHERNEAQILRRLNTRLMQRKERREIAGIRHDPASTNPTYAGEAYIRTGLVIPTDPTLPAVKAREINALMRAVYIDAQLRGMDIPEPPYIPVGPDGEELEVDPVQRV